MDYEIELLLDDSNFEKERLIQGKHVITTNKGARLTLPGFVLPNYEAFELREYIKSNWVLSVNGKLITHGSYEHVIDIIKLLIKRLGQCWNSSSSLVYFLGLDEYQYLISEIVEKRILDHSKQKEQ